MLNTKIVFGFMISIAVNSFVLAQKDIYEVVIKNIESNKLIKRESIKIFGKEAKRFVSKSAFKFVIDTTYNCCSKNLFLSWFSGVIHDNKKLINISIDSLADLYNKTQQTKASYPILLKYSTDTSSKIRIHFSQIISNTIICQIYFYEHYTGYSEDAYDNSAKSKCLSIMYIFDEKLQRIMVQKMEVTPTWKQSPVRFFSLPQTPIPQTPK